MKHFFPHYRYSIFLAILSVCSFIFSCDYLEIPEPKDQLVQNSVFTSDQSANAAIVGIYSSMSNITSSLSYRLQLMAGLSADELILSFQDDNYNQFFINSIITENAYNFQVWRDLYQFIYYANSIIEGIDSSQNLSEEVKNGILGEAKFIRAFFHFYLTSLWGDVPIIIGTDYQTNSIQPRSSKTDVYQQIINDLIDAQQLLSVDYVLSERIRPNRWTATALLARVYLYIGDWENATLQSSSIIDSQQYQLSNLEGVFRKGSSETIWQLLPVFPIFNTIFGGIVLPFSQTQVPNYILTDNLLNLFEINDGRKANWIDSTMVGTQVYHYPSKYKIRTATPFDEYFIVFRLSEQYLIRAEARAMLNNLNGAHMDLTQIRERAGLPTIAIADKEQLLSLIEAERFKELFLEWGDRWLNMKRTGRANDILSAIKSPNWQITDVLWPIPRTQIEANPFLTQNDGYF